MLFARRLLSLGSRAAKDSDQTDGTKFLHDMIERKEIRWEKNSRRDHETNTAESDKMQTGMRRRCQQ